MIKPVVDLEKANTTMFRLIEKLKKEELSEFRKFQLPLNEDTPVWPGTILYTVEWHNARQLEPNYKHRIVSVEITASAELLCFSIYAGNDIASTHYDTTDVRKAVEWLRYALQREK